MNMHDRTPLFVDDAVPLVRDVRIGELEQPGTVFRRKIDTAVAARPSKVVVPICSVQSVALVKVLDERHVSKLVGVAAIFVAVHRGTDLFRVNHERASNRGQALLRVAKPSRASADQRRKHRFLSLVSNQCLVLDRNIYPLS